jgi:hypothetical protein
MYEKDKNFLLVIRNLTKHLVTCRLDSNVSSWGNEILDLSWIFMMISFYRLFLYLRFQKYFSQYIPSS